jgi:hypothetical protein
VQGSIVATLFKLVSDVGLFVAFGPDDDIWDDPVLVNRIRLCTSYELTLLSRGLH